ncbi:MAG TPA: VWA domain-containing protein [Gemmatimonadales bacterium]|nr:VWA domain-containing protein [Gemmatimonadales bacterium]
MALTGAGAPSGEALAANAILFGRLLRRAGLAIDPEQSRTFVQVLELLGVERKQDVKTAGRVIFVRRRDDLPTYDEAFELFWRRRGAAGSLGHRLPRMQQSERRPGALDLSDALSPAEPAKAPLSVVLAGAASSAERLRQADFGELSGAEEREAQRLLAALRPRLPMRPARRGILGRQGSRPALRQMLRRSLASGGQPLWWRWLRRGTRPRPIVLVCDISGSMERYSRFLLRFAHTLARSGAPLEVFVFGTRLTRITRQLKVRSGDEALRRVAGSVVDWSGGTRIGESLRELNQRWVRRTVKSGAIVLLISDGWERGDPELLAREMARLKRSCHRLVWLDPLASREGFEPATLGLKAAMPYVDEFLPCASVASLERLGEMLVSEKGEGRSKK